MLKTTKERKPSILKAKNTLWKVFSEYIRRKYSDSEGMCKCVSCFQVKHWKELQCGHYISRRYNATLFDEGNNHPQCYSCNIMKQGNIVGYTFFLDDTYGKYHRHKLFTKSKEIKRFSIHELEEMTKEYKEKLSKLP